MMESLRVILFTVTPEFVEMIDQFVSERGHKLVGVLTAPGPRSRRTDGYKGIGSSARPNLDVIISNQPSRWADMIRPWKPDIIICGSFNWKIPADVLAVPRLGAYNGHDGFLPKYRGRNATGWALRTGEPGYGVTFHRMTPEFDDGPVLAQREIPISDEDDAESVMARFWEAVAEAHDEAFARLVADDPGIPQDESQVTWAGGAFEPKWRFIDWVSSARDVHRQVRSWCGVRDVPRGAFGLVDGRITRIVRTRFSNATPASVVAAPGTVLSRDGERLVIQCGDAPLEIIAWDYEEVEAAESPARGLVSHA